MYIVLIVILALVGVGLLLAELFLLPGFGAAGVAGVICMAGSICLAYWKISILAGHITLAVSLLLAIIAVIVFFKSRAVDKLALDTEIDSQVQLADPGKKIENLKK